MKPYLSISIVPKSFLPVRCHGGALLSRPGSCYWRFDYRWKQFDGQYQQSLAGCSRTPFEGSWTYDRCAEPGYRRSRTDRWGRRQLARFDRDVLSQPGVSHVVIFLGLTTSEYPGGAFEPRGIIRTADEIIAGYKQLLERARLRAIKVSSAAAGAVRKCLRGNANQGYRQATVMNVRKRQEMILAAPVRNLRTWPAMPRKKYKRLQP